MTSCSPAVLAYLFTKLFVTGRKDILLLVFFSGLCQGKAVVAYTLPQQLKKEESGWLRGERDQIKLIDLRFERWQVVRFRKARIRQDVPQIACSWDE